MKTAIFYSSTYNGNTLRIAQSIAAVLSADLVSIEAKISDIDLLKYDLIGFGSAIHFAEHDILLQRFVSKLSLQEKNVFIFSTRCRPFLGGYHKALKETIKRQKANLVGEFSSVGFDKTGPWVLINGYNKNRPNDKDLFKARLFAEELKQKLNLVSPFTKENITVYEQGTAFRINGRNKIAGYKVVFLNTTSCIQCGKCIKVCPMNIFTKNNTVLPTGEKNCIQCQLCVNHCPTDSIYINVSFANGMRIAFREMFSTKLQNRYKSKAE